MSAALIGAVACATLLGLAASASAGSVDGLARGDAAYLRRAEGGRDGRAAAEPIREAVRAYAEAVAAEPDHLEARWKLLRALHFEGEFATEDRDPKLRVFDRARRVSEEGIARLAEQVGAGEPLHRLDLDALREQLAPDLELRREIAAFYFWSAINWGAWSQVSGLLAAVRSGVANRLHDYARLVLALEPETEQAGAHRLLGALHAQLPRVPFFSGWVDRRRALPHAQSALAMFPEHPGSRLLLALTLLDLHPARRPQALRLLEEVSALTPRASLEVEDLAIRREARERLARERADLDGGTAEAARQKRTRFADAPRG